MVPMDVSQDAGVHAKVLGEEVIVGAALVAALGTHKGCPYDEKDG